MGCKLLISPGGSHTDNVLMNTWNIQPESYKQRAYKSTLATGKHQIQQAETPMPAVVISVAAAPGDNAILLDYLTSEVALKDPEIGCTNLTISIDNNCTNDELHSGRPGGSGDYEDEGEECDDLNAINSASRRWRTATELEMIDLGTS